MQWQFPGSKPGGGGAAPAFMSFRTEEEEGAKEFSISGFRPPAAGGGDAFFDGIKKHAAASSSPATSHQRQFGGFDAQQYRHRAQVLDRGAAAHHPLGGSRMVIQPLSSRRPMPPFNQASPAMPRTQQGLLHNATASGGGALFKNQPSSFAMSNGFGGSTVGAYGARNPRSQNSTQLTIFYNGTVNVFDNVSVEKAQELMLLASKASMASQPNIGSARKPDSPISAPAKINVPEVMPASRQVVTQKPEPSACHLASAPSPISTVPRSVALPRGGASNCTTDSTGRPKTVVQPAPPVVVPTTQQASSSQPMRSATTSAAAVMPRAVPQARKASLARFLEKRKERVTSVEPYPTSKKIPLESSNDTKGSGASALPSKSSLNIAPTSSTGREPLRFGQPMNISFSGEMHPSTKLHI